MAETHLPWVGNEKGAKQPLRDPSSAPVFLALGQFARIRALLLRWGVDAHVGILVHWNSL